MKARWPTIEATTFGILHPETSFSTDHQSKQAMKELKTMIRAYPWGAGISVVLDVIHNHIIQTVWSFPKIQYDYCLPDGPDGR